MPTSNKENKRWALERIKAIDPRSVLDVGPGEGTYSDVARRHTRAHWMAVEAWGPYVSKYNLWSKYNHVVVADIRHCDLQSIHAPADLAIVGDVLEHMTKVEARGVLARLTAWADNVIVCIPLIHCEQDAYEGNWFEIHREHWTFDEMAEELSDGLVASKRGKVLGYFHWSCGA